MPGENTKWPVLNKQCDYISINCPLNSTKIKWALASMGAPGTQSDSTNVTSVPSLLWKLCPRAESRYCKSLYESISVDQATMSFLSREQHSDQVEGLFGFGCALFFSQSHLELMRVAVHLSPGWAALTTLPIASTGAELSLSERYSREYLLNTKC